MDEKYVRNLENTIKEMIKPIKNIPFKLVIESISNCKLLSFDENNNYHKKVLQDLITVAKDVGKSANKEGIRSKRVNEAGNYVEKFVRNALKSNNLEPSTPITTNGKRKGVGYPDFTFKKNNSDYYLEIKTYNKSNKNTTQR